jgi:Rod binding domain-containing protein
MRVDFSTGSTGGQGGLQPRTLEEAAVAFEGLLIGQMLKIAREASESESGQSEGGAIREFAEEHLAQQLAGAGIGVARQIMEQMGTSGNGGQDQKLHSIGSASSTWGG